MTKGNKRAIATLLAIIAVLVLARVLWLTELTAVIWPLITSHPVVETSLWLVMAGIVVGGALLGKRWWEKRQKR